MRIVWVCALSNPEIRQYYKIHINPLLKTLLKIKGRFSGMENDFAIWNTNAIREFEHIPDVELHIVSPVRYLSKSDVQFVNNGVHYHFFRDQHSGLFSQLYYQFFDKYTCRFRVNRRRIKNIIKKINPQLVHVMGAENPYYSLAAIDIPKDTILIVQLQALLMRLVDITKNARQKVDFSYKGKLEAEIIAHADYVGTTATLFRDYLKLQFPNVRFLDISLAMGPVVYKGEDQKEFDFVYYAANINKAGLDALNAFVLAKKSVPDLTLDIIGRYDPDYKMQLDKIIVDNAMEGSVFFEGLLPSHDDVIQQIRKAKYALLPLKMDIIPNTIIEAMSNGLVVVTTVTVNGTPKLNERRECVLLSKQGDYQAMADNMVKLISDNDFALRLRENSYITIEESHSNTEIIAKWFDTYKLLLS